ncbi:MAG: phosphoribosyltransferase family protein [Candidatus Nomurabacteria bacterium]|nr:phosphoribosyltransferase family protein [Candidatus Nomurabacteria bacterium]
MLILDTILNIVFPVNCVSCGKDGSDLCIKCLSDSPPAERESANWIFPLFDYRHPPIKKSIWLLKYKGKKRLAGVFAEVLYGKIIEELSELSVMNNFCEPILIPIPLSKRRYRERGYNQAELICGELIKLDHLTRPSATLSLTRRGAGGEVNKNFSLEKNVLVKIKETEHQANIKERRDRLKNLSDSFAIKNPELIKNKNIILIDDVLTTGATLTEAKKILKNSGARKVIAFTIAH